ncbi:MAG: hypothetical protein QOG06_1695, partial [Gaiellaceae bacterium]|nr:hypothetical protein [Gaiellaceae bacterium]
NACTGYLGVDPIRKLNHQALLS